MRIALPRVIILAATISIAGCSSLQMSQSNDERRNRADYHAEQGSNSPVAGNLQKTMDENDKVKMFHALDKPVGKSTQWTNQYTHVSYTVEPIKKLAVNGNPFCRQYRVTSIKNTTRNEMNGVACVSSIDSSWQVVK